MQERPLLILDLDETLIWATHDKLEVPEDFRVSGYSVLKRPHVDAFLEQASAWFELAVWTSAGEDYAEAVVTALFQDPSQLLFVWSSSRCTRRWDRDRAEYRSVKDLKKVRRRGFPLRRILVIDDSPHKLQRQYGNHLPLTPFRGDPQDRELLDVLPFLSWIRTQTDFRKIEKRGWRGSNLTGG